MLENIRKRLVKSSVTDMIREQREMISEARAGSKVVNRCKLLTIRKRRHMANKTNSKLSRMYNSILIALLKYIVYIAVWKYFEMMFKNWNA